MGKYKERIEDNTTWYQVGQYEVAPQGNTLTVKPIENSPASKNKYLGVGKSVSANLNGEHPGHPATYEEAVLQTQFTNINSAIYDFNDKHKASLAPLPENVDPNSPAMQQFERTSKVADRLGTLMHELDAGKYTGEQETLKRTEALALHAELERMTDGGIDKTRTKGAETYNFLAAANRLHALADGINNIQGDGLAAEMKRMGLGEEIAAVEEKITAQADQLSHGLSIPGNVKSNSREH